MRTAEITGFSFTAYPEPCAAIDTRGDFQGNVLLFLNPSRPSAFFAGMGYLLSGTLTFPAGF